MGLIESCSPSIFYSKENFDNYFLCRIWRALRPLLQELDIIILLTHSLMSRKYVLNVVLSLCSHLQSACKDLSSVYMCISIIFYYYNVRNSHYNWCNAQECLLSRSRNDHMSYSHWPKEVRVRMQYAVELCSVKKRFDFVYSPKLDEEEVLSRTR